jgi:hypothetical protein
MEPRLEAAIPAAADLLMPPYLFAPAARAYLKLNFKTVDAISGIFNTATAIRLVDEDHSLPACLSYQSGPQMVHARARRTFAMVSQTSSTPIASPSASYTAAMPTT